MIKKSEVYDDYDYDVMQGRGGACRAVILVTPLLEYFGECTIWVAVLLEYVDLAFSICGCFCFMTH